MLGFLQSIRKHFTVIFAMFGSFLTRQRCICALVCVCVIATVPLAYSEERFQVETLASGLDHPWSIAFLPNGNMLVTERSGRVRLIENGSLASDPIADTPPAYVKSQGGYFDILVDPDFTENQFVYLSYAHGSAKANTTRIVRARLEGGAFSQTKVIFDTAPTKDTPVHYGGRMAFLADGTLLMTTGDGFDYREKAQIKSNLLGKTIRINTDGTIPSDNPFAQSDDSHDAIWTYGHRSPQGLAVDPKTGMVFQNEHGPRGGDEVNLLQPGLNYGWPIATYGLDYSGATISPFKKYPGTQQPLYYWVPSIATSGLAIYRGDQFPDWDGDVFVGGLVTKALHRLTMENGKVVNEELLLKQLRWRIRDVRIGPEGAIYVVTDEADGRVLRLTPQ